MSASLLPRARACLVSVAACFGVFFGAQEAVALTLQAPVGGAAFPLPQDRILCGQAPEGWTADTMRRHLRPPADKQPGTTATVSVGKGSSGCAPGAIEQITVVLTGPTPTIDAGSVSVFVDSGRLEARGDALEGVHLAWRAGDRVGSGVCLNVPKDKGRDLCSLSIDKKLLADPRNIAVWWAPVGGRAEPDVVTFDKTGGEVPEEQRRLPVGRIMLSHVFSDTRTIDVATGEGHVEFVHPEAVASVECGAARCEMSGTGVVVRGVPAALQTVSIRARLLPRVFIAHGEAVDTVASDTLTVLRCPLSVASGPPLRGVDHLRVLVHMDRACSRDVDHLRWTANGDIVRALRTEDLPEGQYALIDVERVTGDRLTVTAAKEEDGAVVAVASERTWEVPPLQTSLSLLEFGQIDFIPKNRDAFLTVSPIPGGGTLLPVSVPGAYVVTERKDGYHVRGVYASGGYASLRFVYRISSVPETFRDTDFATLVDPVQRPIREANVPAPLGASSVTKNPIVELVCSVKKGKPQTIQSGEAVHIPFSERDSCHLVIHRDRIPSENGEQRVDLDVSVSTVSGADRGEAKLSEHIVLRYGSGTDVIWVRGSKEQFDKVTIRVTHVIDETQYMGRSTTHVRLPSAQWTIVTEDAKFRFYATAAIPTALYRFSSDPQDLGTGPLALNFGVLSRLTWLNSEGSEGLVGLEAGMMGMGLATEKDRQLALVAGFGISIPIGNVNQPTQASVNIHAWGAYTIGERKGTLTDETGKATGTVTLNPWAFVFGPSITIGNVGTFL